MTTFQHIAAAADEVAAEKIAIERGHFTIARSLLRRLAVAHPEQVLFSARGRDLKGREAIEYLDSMPAERLWISDCPNRRDDGDCGCFDS